MIAFLDLLECPDDLQARVREWRNRDHVRAQMVHTRPVTPEEHARWLAALPGRADLRYWIVTIDGVPAGVANLQNMDPASGVTEWGLYLGEPAFLGKGFGRRILAELLRRAFVEFGFREVRAKVRVGNAAARALYAKLGFRDVGGAEEPGDGEMVALRRMALTRAEWETGAGGGATPAARPPAGATR